STGLATALPLPIPALEGVTSVSAETIACAIAGGDLYCWGVNTDGTICTGAPAGRFDLVQLVPVKHGADAIPQQISVGAGGPSCVRLTDGTVQCCGTNTYGQLGLGPRDGGPIVNSVSTFTSATALEGHAVQVASPAAGGAVCAVLRTG